MKQIILLFISLIFAASGNAQVNIQQIASSGFESFQGLMATNQDKSNVAELIQLGNQNQASISQTRENHLLSGNQAYVLQEGSQNNMNAEQKGSNNAMLSFQLTYLTSLWGSSGATGYLNFLSEILPLTTSFSSEISKSENNSVVSKQEGNSNGLITLQVGQDNQIYTTQNGEHNYLLISQLGQGHLIQDFKQENQSGGFLLETISQLGSNNFLEVANASSSQLYGNSYSQMGENLSLQVNSSFLSATGGMEVSQTGYDMKVVIDQSYFSFPMK